MSDVADDLGCTIRKTAQKECTQNFASQVLRGHLAWHSVSIMLSAMPM